MSDALLFDDVFGVNSTSKTFDRVVRVHAKSEQHDMDLVLDVCDYVYVLEFGKLIAEGRPAEVRDNDDVIAAYLGEELAS